MKILIFGASGSGTTTLGKELARHFGWKWLDADRYYWADTDPPFQRKIPLEERNSQIRKDFMSSDAVIISGSMVSWGAQWEKAFDLAVFLYIPPALRMERLRKREVERYGELLQTDATTLANSKAFLEWAEKYDDEDFVGRSITQHNQWMNRLTCPVLRIEGDTSVKERLDRIIERIKLFPLIDKKS